MGNVYNGVASEYEIPREPVFYENPPGVVVNQPMPLITKVNSSCNKICNNCCKEDVCMYKEELNKAINDIASISARTNVFIDVNIKCKHWAEQVVCVR